MAIPFFKPFLKSPKICQISKPEMASNVHVIYKGHRISRLNITEGFTNAMVGKLQNNALKRLQVPSEVPPWNG